MRRGVWKWRGRERVEDHDPFHGFHLISKQTCTKRTTPSIQPKLQIKWSKTKIYNRNSMFPEFIILSIRYFIIRNKYPVLIFDCIITRNVNISKFITQPFLNQAVFMPRVKASSIDNTLSAVVFNLKPTFCILVDLFETFMKPSWNLPKNNHYLLRFQTTRGAGEERTIRVWKERMENLSSCLFEIIYIYLKFSSLNFILTTFNSTLESNLPTPPPLPIPQNKNMKILVTYIHLKLQENKFKKYYNVWKIKATMRKLWLRSMIVI